MQQMIIARLSLNNPSKISHYSKKICHKNDRTRERERETQREKATGKDTNKKERKEKERERASKAPQVAFLSSHLPVL